MSLLAGTVQAGFDDLDSYVELGIENSARIATLPAGSMVFVIGSGDSVIDDMQQSVGGYIANSTSGDDVLLGSTVIGQNTISNGTFDIAVQYDSSESTYTYLRFFNSAQDPVTGLVEWGSSPMFQIAAPQFGVSEQNFSASNTLHTTSTNTFVLKTSPPGSGPFIDLDAFVSLAIMNSDQSAPLAAGSLVYIFGSADAVIDTMQEDTGGFIANSVTGDDVLLGSSYVGQFTVSNGTFSVTVGHYTNQTAYTYIRVFDTSGAPVEGNVAWGTSAMFEVPAPQFGISEVDYGIVYAQFADDFDPLGEPAGVDFASVAMQGSQTLFQWSATNACHYTIEFTPTLGAAASWTNLPGYTMVPGTNGIMSYAASPRAALFGFHRIRAIFP